VFVGWAKAGKAPMVSRATEPRRVASFLSYMDPVEMGAHVSSFSIAAESEIGRNYQFLRPVLQPARSD
jgi:hypothetical protein